VTKQITPNSTIHEFEINLGGGGTDTFFTSDAIEVAYIQKYFAANIKSHTDFTTSDPSNNGQPVYRFFDKESSTHFYTLNANEERETAKLSKFTYEGIAFYALKPGVGSTNFERFFNPNTGAHGFAKNQEEVDTFINKGFVSEGAAWSFAAVGESVSQPASLNNDQSPNPSSIPAKLYLALCGGGFNTHTMLSGFFSGVLDGLSAAGNGTLAGMMGEVDGVSANSGGAWFLTQLAYSKKFKEALETTEGRNSWNTAGYIGQLKNQLAPISQQTFDSAAWLNKNLPIPGYDWNSNKTILNTLDTVVLPSLIYYEQLISAAGNIDLNLNSKWIDIIKKVVFAPYDMANELSSLTLNSQRQDWAANKDLVFPASLVTDKSVLNNQGIAQDKTFAEVIPVNSNIDSYLSDFPFIIKSDFSEGNPSPVGVASLTNSPFNLTYTGNALWPFTPNPISNKLGQDYTANISVLDAASISSSAAAFTASPEILRDGYRYFEGLINSATGLNLKLPDSLITPILNQAAWAIGDQLSPLVSLANSQFNTLGGVPSDSFKDNANAQIVRIGDGGFNETTSCAYMLKDLQKSDGTSSPFDLTLVVTSYIDEITGIKMFTSADGQQSAFTVSQDISKLFGNNDGKNNDPATIKFFNFLDQPSPKIFKPDAWYGLQAPTWQYSSGSVSAKYFDLNVETADNATFGIAGGQKGALHLLWLNNPESNVAPLSAGVFNEYADNYSVIKDAFANQGGLPYIKQALGLYG